MYVFQEFTEEYATASQSKARNKTSGVGKLLEKEMPPAKIQALVNCS